MKYLGLILLSSVFLTPCFAQEIRYKFKVSPELQKGFISDEGLKGIAVISNIHPGYVVSDHTENGQVIAGKGFEVMVFPNDIKDYQGITWGEQNDDQGLKGRIFRFKDTSESSWAEFAKMYMESGLPGDLSKWEREEVEIYQIGSPVSYFREEGQEDLVGEKMLSVGPGNGGGGSQYDMRLYFIDSQESLAVEKAVKFAEEFGASEGTVTVSPFFYSWNSPEVLDALAGMQRAYKDEVTLSVWGKTSEDLDKKSLQKLFEYSGLGEVVVEENRAFSAYQGLGEGYSVGVIVEVPEDSFREKAGVAYKGYGEIGQQHIFLKDIDGMSDFSVDFFK